MVISGYQNCTGAGFLAEMYWTAMELEKSLA